MASASTSPRMIGFRQYGAFHCRLLHGLELYAGSAIGHKKGTQSGRLCRCLNAAARLRPHCRHRQRRSCRFIRMLSGISACPLPQWFGTSMTAILWRRAALENGIVIVLLLGSTPPLPFATVCIAMHRIALSIGLPSWLPNGDRNRVAIPRAPTGGS